MHSEEHATGAAHHREKRADPGSLEGNATSVSQLPGRGACHGAPQGCGAPPARPANGLAVGREDDVGRAADQVYTCVRRGAVALVVAADCLMLPLLDLDRFVAVEYQVEFVETDPVRGR
ncbi:hypothetical protein GCM10020000_84460 [Streptomyces olivoverticillatus]